ncbi:MAG: hypothetical protein ACQERK_07715 [Campylobacterota bacterium]
MNIFSAILTKRFVAYLLAKLFGLFFMMIALYLIFFIEQTNFVLVAVLFAASLFFSTSALKMDPKPPQARCLEGKGFMISFFVPTAMSLSLVMVLLVFLGSGNFGGSPALTLIGSLIVLLATISIYFKECAKSLPDLMEETKKEMEDK